MSSKKKKAISDSEEEDNSEDNSKEEESHNSNSNNSNEKDDSSDQEQNSSSQNIEKVEKHREEEKNKLALKIKKENENFMKGIEQGRHERLKFLLKQTEIFAHFLIGGKAEDSSKNKKSEKGSKRKNVTSANNTAKDIELLKDNDNDLEEEVEKEITRLYVQPSILVGGKLTNYQLDGLNWIISLYERGLNGILADEMGLGKTIQSIAFLAYLKQFQKKNGYFLVVVPKSTMPNWSRECKLWCPRLNAIVLNPVKEEREETLALISEHKFEVVITSYEGVNICINKLKKIKWEVLIIDEAHRIKNENAILSKNVRLLQSKFRLLVTGTPLQNNLHELWSLLNFLLPDIFSSSSDFDEWFNMGGGDNNNKTTEGVKENMEDAEDKNAEIVQQLHKILKPFLLRRTKSEVEKTLPPKKEIHIKVGLTELQKDIYKNLLTRSLLQTESKTIYKNIIMQLRKACNHPYLFEGIEKPNPPPNHLVIYSSKMRILDKLCNKLFGKSQILIFSQMTRMLDILEDYCNERRYQYCRIDGDTSLEARERMITEFTQKNSSKFIFLLSTRAGGLGLNLMTSDTVILYDSDWNPQVDLQAMDRVHRIGQTKPVLIYRLLCENTIEEKILERQAMRLKLDSLVIQQGRVLKVGEHFTKDQMKEMIQYGADAIYRPGNDFKDEDIDLILKRGEEQTNKFFEEAEKQAKSKSNLLLNFSFDPNDLYKFENEDYRLKRKENADRVLSKALEEEIEKEQKMIYTRRDHGHVIYNVDQAQAHLFVKNKKKTRLPKIPIYHLYKNREKLLELKQKQINYFLNENKKLPEKIDEDATIEEGLTKAEFKEMSSILKKGFPDWSKKEYDIFVNAADLYGKKCIDTVAKDITSKSKEDIIRYSKVFWELIEELPEGQRILKNMEKKEKLEKQKNHSSRLISKKCENFDDDEYENIRIIFPPGNHQSEYTYEDDQYLIYVTNKYGYGNWDDILREVKTSEDLLFNYYLKSRNKAEIQKRVDYLVKLIEKEIGSLVPINGDDVSKNSNVNTKKKNPKQIVIDEDYEEEKNNDNGDNDENDNENNNNENNDEKNMVTDDEEIYAENNDNNNNDIKTNNKNNKENENDNEEDNDEENKEDENDDNNDDNDDNKDDDEEEEKVNSLLGKKRKTKDTVKA
jgi:SWI/SNF-related matrix-associated actin-dependent regulator of chromatin subfamily A member 5